MTRASVAFLALVLPLPAASADGAWDHWRSLLQQVCPSHHVNWACDSCWTQITGAFEDTLKPAERRAIQSVIDPHACDSEEMGHSCEMGEALQAYERLGLLKRFTAHSCKIVKCEEPALCSRFPKHAP